MEGLRTPTELVVIVVILLSYGCPIQAIVHAYGWDERTVADWQKRAGKYCQQIHQSLVEQGKVQTHHVQADEIRAKGRKMVIWMAMAIDATSRLWMAGVVSVRRDRDLADRLLHQVRACCQAVGGLLVCTDGSLSGEHYACLSRQGEKDRWSGKMLLRDLAAAVYCHGDQAHREETGGGSHTQAHVGSHGESARAAQDDGGMSAVQYVLD